MGISSYGLLLFLVIMIAVVSGFGSCAGYTVAGIEQAGISSEAPGLLGVVDWVWDSLQFMFHLSTFQVDNMPGFIGVIFVIMSLMTVFLIVKLIRGSA